MSQNKKDKNENKQDNKLIMLIIGLAILIIALVGVAIFYVKTQDKKDEKTLAYTNLIKEISYGNIEKVEMTTGSTTVKVN